MKPMVYCVASRGWPGWIDCVKTWMETASAHYNMYVCMDQPLVPALQECYESTHEPVLAYIHDDVQIFEPGWDLRVLKEFEDESVGLVGLGGALGHGRPELYRVPYHLPDLARQNFLSNMRSWQQHGGRETGARDVAVIDGFAGFVRRSVLDRWRHGVEEAEQDFTRFVTTGFPFGVPVGYYMVWENLCCEVRRQGYKIRLVGIDCEHIGGRTSVMHGAVDSNYEEEHKYFYDQNRDMMPYRVKG